MSTFGSIERNYYTPAEDNIWDIFVDAMTEQGFNPEDEDFDGWAEDYIESREDEAAERAYDYSRDER